MPTENTRRSISQRSQLPAVFFCPVPCMVLALGGQQFPARMERPDRPGPYTRTQPRKNCVDLPALAAPGAIFTRRGSAAPPGIRLGPLSLAVVLDTLGVEESADDHGVHREPGVQKLVLDL